MAVDERRVEQLEERMERFEERMERLEGRMERLEERLHGVELALIDLRATFERRIADAVNTQTRTLVFSQLGALLAMAAIAFGIG